VHEEAQSAPLVMIVEDEAVVALDLELTLRDEGYRVLGPVATVATGLELLLAHRPDFAVLDFNLGGEPVTSVALQLRRMAVPFVLVSAHPKVQSGSSPAFDGVTNIGKPLDHRALLQTISATLRH